MMRRFAYWERRGKRCVLLACNDHDPGGFNISDFIKSNLNDLQGAVGWSPENLKVDRFGLNAAFIRSHRLSWIDNLKRQVGDDLDNPRHPDHYKPYVQDYIKQFGVTEGRGKRADCPPRSRSRTLPSGHPEIRFAVGGRCVCRRLSVEQRKVQADSIQLA